MSEGQTQYVRGTWPLSSEIQTADTRLDRIGFGAATAVPAGPDAGEEGEQPFLAERELGRRLVRLGVGVFTERIEGHYAAMRREQATRASAGYRYCGYS